MMEEEKCYRSSTKEVTESLYGWQVERSIGWFNFFRRLSKAFEKMTHSAQVFVQLAFMNIILTRFAQILAQTWS